MTTLMTLTQKLEDLCDLIDNQNGEIPSDLLERFHEANIDHSQKLDAYVFVINRLRADSAFYSERSEKISRRAKTCERIEKALKEQLMFRVQQHPDLPWKSTEGDQIRIQASPEALKIALHLEKKSFSNILSPMDLDAVPPTLIKQITFNQLDTEATKHYLKNFRELPWAKLERGQHLRL